MKAILCTELSGPDGLQMADLPAPTAGPGQVVVGVRACGVNFADTLLVQGKYQEKPPLPFIPGAEIAGDVLAVGEGVEGLRVGQRVAALCEMGGFAERVAVTAERCVPLPDPMAYETAAGFLITYGTSHVGLAHRAKLQAGETLLVHGAAGGVGLAAVEIGALLGATVIATASSAEKLALTRQYGAAHTIDYTQENFVERVKSITGGHGADVIYDPVGGDVFDQSLRCIAWEGRLLVIGFASGRIPQIPAGLLLVKNASAVGLYWGAYAKRNPQVLSDSLASLFAWHAAGKLKPHISATFPLAETAEALRSLMERRSRGKVVVAVTAQATSPVSAD